MTAALEVAENAARLADLNPSSAVSAASEAARSARREGDNAAASIAERAWGHSLVQCGELATAIRHLRRAVDHGLAADSAELVSEARIRLAYALILRGKPELALGEIDGALNGIQGDALMRIRAQRGAILVEIGRLDEALADLDRALPYLRRIDDRVGVARALVNRGIVHGWLHDFAAAVRDLRESGQVSRALGRGLAVGIVEQNLGFVAALRGHVPAALDHLATAERTIAEHGGQLAAVLQDHGELLLSVGLTSEAREFAERAIVACQREQRRLKIPELRLLLAQIAFLDSDWQRCLEQADLALRGFSRQRRAAWTALARLARYRAKLALGQGERISSVLVEDMVGTLAGSGWPAAEVEARVVAARVSFLRGRPDQGGEQLRQAARARGRGPAAIRARGWFAEARLREENDDPRGAAVAARAGLRVLDEHAAALGATDLRVHSAAHRVELSELGLRTAIRAGRPAGVLEWAERGRANRLLHRPVLPAEDPVLAGLLARLRSVSAEISLGRPSPAHRQLTLERQIRDHCRLHPPQSGGPAVEPVRPNRLGTALGERALAEFVQWDGILHALTLVDRRLRLRPLGPVSLIAESTERLLFALHRLARKGPAQPAAAALLADTARRLDDLLLGPLPELDRRPLVLVPTGLLHSMPWSVLPSCLGRPVTVSPSATLWCAASSAPVRPARTVLVAAGPDLPGARDEALAVAAIHGCTPLVDGTATVDGVLAALADAEVAHLATHGSLNTDNPLFSSLRLADGPLIAYDLERLPRVPHTVILACCDGGRSVVRTGDELLGLSTTFMSRSATRLIASVMPIPDAETAPLMIALHRGMATGRPAPVALAEAQQEMRDRSLADLAAAAGFVSIGGD
ncbi:CHAT domain-containing protein [Amycolatopsis pretoriensis]|uniref:CHAT domain-containing protein n=1 Tax=Amycolatopsis pretoriensis TaxID=218821 RepID=A0A1H5QZB4_9PSEU|nr:CHAT domain-containing tetratricopeptide repeat protein [Amycolatopsis pretoriensis]SEF30678.1 CHAT domain-containing protein [Amycolatopsis pretoriensis]